MDKNLLRAQLLMEAADLLNEESYEELDESYRKPNTNERYALAKGYVNYGELRRRDRFKNPKDAPGVMDAKDEMNQKNHTVHYKPSKVLDRAFDIMDKRHKDFYGWHGDDDTKKALFDRLWDARNEASKIDYSIGTPIGWAPEYNDPKGGTHRKPEDYPDAHWKNYVKSEGKDPWRQYPGKK